MADSNDRRERLHRLRPWLRARAAWLLGGGRRRAQLDPSDLTQETLRKALLGVDQCRAQDTGEMKGWLDAVLRHAQKDDLARRAAEKRGCEWKAQALGPGTGELPPSALPGRDPGPSGPVLFGELLSLVEAGKERLTERERRALEQHGLSGSGTPEAGAPDNRKTRMTLHRARKKMAAHLRSYLEH